MIHLDECEVLCLCCIGLNLVMFGLLGRIGHRFPTDWKAIRAVGRTEYEVRPMSPLTPPLSLKQLYLAIHQRDQIQRRHRGRRRLYRSTIKPTTSPMFPLKFVSQYQGTLLNDH